MSFYFNINLKGKSFETTIKLVTEALKSEGFGIITEIDLKQTFKNKLDLDFENHIILGACNPSFAHKAVSSDDKMSLLLPCNVTIRQANSDEIEISAIDAVQALGITGNKSIIPFAEEVNQKLKNALSKIK